MAGRPPRATKLLLLEGGFRKDRHAKRLGEPQPAGTLPAAAPAWFSAYEREAWEHGLKHAPAGLLKPLDASVYTVWCVACAHHREVAEHLARLGVEGLLSRTADRVGPRDANGVPIIMPGTAIQSPLVGILNRQALLMLKAASELGFSPVARARVGGEAPAVDSDAEFFHDA